ncbi:MAG: c-type cytochrome [Gammaproteobacteria bacterium]
MMPAMWARNTTILAIVAVMALRWAATRADDVRKHAPGGHLYQVSCAGCHGADARGNGPVSPFLTVKVPDLTLISARRGGVFPDLEIFRIIDGQAELRSHGPRHMPVWGYEFFGDDPDDEVAHRQATDKVDRLVTYLRSIQRTEQDGQKRAAPMPMK